MNHNAGGILHSLEDVGSITAKEDRWHLRSRCATEAVGEVWGQTDLTAVLLLPLKSQVTWGKFL